MIEHWDGRQWNYVSLVGPTSDANDLTSITAISPIDIWAAGSLSNAYTQLDNVYMQHWNGKEWELAIWPTADGQLKANSAVSIADISVTPDRHIIGVGSSTIFKQLPPTADADHDPEQPFVLTNCR
ncbi:hypothetical protein KDA_48830 [Dictyobacter alpinus]|uniref:Uncharacterized protein n=1 Tax=Dictyobacter alpinus TaxID=2014873 RepID=A0A402BDK1_9CHLR|nr:hypothetical protein [Dictyobacter alpinus]GCE29399.1 hypothetical protein KDA_48830 [Dictyobacter alpinus]